MTNAWKGTIIEFAISSANNSIAVAIAILFVQQLQRRYVSISFGSVNLYLYHVVAMIAIATRNVFGRRVRFHRTGNYKYWITMFSSEFRAIWYVSTASKAKGNFVNDRFITERVLISPCLYIFSLFISNETLKGKVKSLNDSSVNC